MFYNDSQHKFMTALREMLVACAWDDDEAFLVSYEALTYWENGFRWEYE